MDRIKIHALLMLLLFWVKIANADAQSLAQYQQLVSQTRLSVQQLLKQLTPIRHQSPNEQIAYIAANLTDIPYMYSGASGEGDWQPRATSYQAGAVHVNQSPVYRLDGLDCVTFLQVAMALYYAHQLQEFDRTILNLAYGAAGNPHHDIVRYYNRNNFVEGDFNPINRAHGYLQDVTSSGPLAAFAKSTSAELTRQNWFNVQQQQLNKYVQVLKQEDRAQMVNRFITTYSHLNFPHFVRQTVHLTYLPKERLAIRQPDGTYQPNETILAKIPTPAVIEMVNDVKKWNINGRNIKDWIGSELLVSHVGLLYRQTFKRGELIYQKITCGVDHWRQEKRCAVAPIRCDKTQCNELMFAHATDAYPRRHYWYQQSDQQFVCSLRQPVRNQPYTMCNRVERLPLFAYLTNYQFGMYWNMTNPALVGIHVERIVG